MTEEEHIAVATRLGELFEASKESNNLGTSGHIKQALFRLASESSRLDRFPSIRKLSEIFQAAPASVQRAVSELIAENVLMVRSGVGIFVRTPPSPAPMRDVLSYSQSGRYKVEIFHWESDEGRRAMMLELVERFRNEHLGHLALQLHFEEPSVWPDITINLPGPAEALPLRRLAAHEIARGTLRVADDDTAPLAYHALYLFCSRKALKSLDLPLPEYETFDEQIAYVRRVVAHCEECGIPRPVSINRPAAFLGNRAHAFARGGDLAELRADFQRVLSYCGMFHHARDLWEVGGIERFNKGEFPIFAAYTCAVNAMEDPDDLLVYPEIAIDGGAVLDPLIGSIDARTRNPVECARFFAFLQRSDSQDLFREQHFVGVDRRGKHFNTPALRAAAARAFGGYFADPVERYIYSNILDHGFLMLVDDPSRFELEWEDMVAYSQSYTQTRKGEIR